MGLLSSLTSSVTSAISGSVNDVISTLTSNFSNYQGDAQKHPVLDSILSTKWDVKNEFDVYIYNNFIADKMGDTDIFTKETFDKSIVSLTLPEVASQEMDNVVGGLRRHNVKMYESFRFSITFRDFSDNILRKMFTNIWVAQQYMYYDYIATGVYILKGQSVLFSSDRCLITNISVDSYDQSATDFVTFTVNFISSELNNTYLERFGSDADYDKAFSST